MLATMRSPQGSMVNLDGDLVEIGEEYKEFRLIAVRESTAIFEREGSRYSISLDKIEEKDDQED